VHSPHWARQYQVRQRVWHTFARLGLTGLHSGPIHRAWLDVRRIAMPLEGLDPAFEGFRIAQISDLHVSPVVWRGFLAEQLRHVADLKPDLLVVTGDLITGGYRYARLAADLLAHIEPRPPHGIICTLGNHDYSLRGKRSVLEAARRGKYFQKVLGERGLILLVNQPHRIRLPEARRSLTIVGLDDLWSGRLDARKAFSGVGPDETVICLNHDPRNTMELMEHPWQWMLSGHTHGRQLAQNAMGRRFNLKRRREFVRGRYELPGGRRLYVNRGLSYGQRFEHWCKPEITLFRLTARPAPDGLADPV
jgi:hypothetical protein